MKRLLLIIFIPLLLMAFRTGGYRTNITVPHNIHLGSDSLGFGIGTADSAWIYETGSNLAFDADNTFAFLRNVSIASDGALYITTDGQGIYNYGRFTSIDSDADDSLSSVIWGATDSLKWDSIPEAVTLTCPLTVEKITSDGITQFPYVDLDIDDTEEYELTAADGKAGWGMASLEDEWTFFRFTAAGAVTLVNETTNVGTTNGTDNKFNIYDSGTTITFENQLGDNKELNINVWFTP